MYDEKRPLEIKVCPEAAPLVEWPLKLDALLEIGQSGNFTLDETAVEDIFLYMSPRCTEFEYLLIQDLQQTPVLSKFGMPVFSIDPESHTLQIAAQYITAGKHTFYVYQKPMSGKMTEAYKEVQLTVEFKPNKAPEFKKAFPSALQIEIDVKEQESGDIEDFVYVSSKIEDEEGHNPVVSTRLPIEEKKMLEGFLKVTYNQ